MIVVVNIVLAVLLDEFLKAADKEKYETFMERHITDGSASHFQGPLDPFLEYISQFYNWDELLARILEAFRLFDTDHDGEIDFDDVSEGLRRLALQPKVLRDRVALGLARREQTRVHACTHTCTRTHMVQVLHLHIVELPSRADAAWWSAVLWLCLAWFRLGGSAQVRISLEDWRDMTNNGALTTERDTLSAAQFVQVMRNQVTLYVQRVASKALALGEDAGGGATSDSTTFMLKYMISAMDELRNVVLASGPGWPEHPSLREANEELSGLKTATIPELYLGDNHTHGRKNTHAHTYLCVITSRRHACA